MATALSQNDYYWTGTGTPNAHGNREWGDAGNWELDSAGSGNVPATGPTTNLDAPGPYDNVFLSASGTTYLHYDGGPSTYQRIQNLTILGGTNAIGSRYVNGNSDGSPSLLIEGNLNVQAGSFFGGSYSPNNIIVLGTLSAAQGTILGNNNSTSDGGFWDLSGATAVEFNGVELRGMTNNWQWSPQSWDFGNTPITRSHSNPA